MRISPTNSNSAQLRQLTKSNAALSAFVDSRRDSELSNNSRHTLLDNLAVSNTAPLTTNLAELDGAFRRLDSISERINVIRGTIQESSTTALSPVGRAQARALIDQMIIEINELAGTHGISSSPGSIRVSPLNTTQLQSLAVEGVESGTTRILGGELISPGSKASLTLTGDSSGLVIESASLTLTGMLGSTNISISEGEVLSAVANRVNERSGLTGVVAEVEENQLHFISEAAGSANGLSVSSGTEAQTVDVSGVNPTQVADFDVDSIDADSSEILNGSVSSTATKASLALLGDPGGFVKNAATFDLSGSLGTANISIAQGEALADVQTRVNQLTETTGVSAEVDGDNLIFLSTDSGSAAVVTISPTSVDPDIDISGVNGSQVVDFEVVSIDTDTNHTINAEVTAVAGQAELTYTGVIQGLFGVTASNATFDLTGDTGTVSYSVTAGEALSLVRDRINQDTNLTGVVASVSSNTLTLSSVGVGSASAIQIDVTSGTFNVSGGNGDGTANGTDAEAVINGQNLTGNGNRFTLDEGTALFELEFASTFTGSIDPVSVTSSAGDFEITGGDGSGSAEGTDAQAVIDGQNLTGVGNTFSLNTSTGSYSLTFADGFEGTFDAITITSVGGAALELVGGDGQGNATGSDAVARINGQTLIGEGNKFVMGEGDATFTFQVADGFNGSFDPVTVTSIARESTDPISVTFAPARSARSVSQFSIRLADATRLGGVTGTLDQLATGGQHSDFIDRTDDALSITTEALLEIDRLTSALQSVASVAFDPLLESQVDPSFDPAATAFDLLTQSAADPQLAVGAVQYVPDRILALMQQTHSSSASSFPLP